MHKGRELGFAAVGHAGQAFRQRVPGTQEESLSLLSPAMRAGMPTERSALTRNMLSPVQEAYPAAITCIRLPNRPGQTALLSCSTCGRDNQLERQCFCPLVLLCGALAQMAALHTWDGDMMSGV